MIRGDRGGGLGEKPYSEREREREGVEGCEDASRC